MKKHQVLIDPSKCTGCGLCVKTCVAHNIELENKKAKTLLKNCLMCGQCTAVCPGKAVTISGYDAEEIKEKIETSLKPQEVLDVILSGEAFGSLKKKTYHTKSLNRY